MESYHVALRRSGSSWRWFLLELDFVVKQGQASTWAEAQRSAEQARKAYVKDLRSRRKVKMSDI